MSSAVLIATTCVYSSFSSVFFSAFNSSTIDGERYLSVDLSIYIDSGDHAPYLVLAALMIVVFTLGVPLFYLLLLWPHRKTLTSIVARKADPNIRHLAFIYDDYSPNLWYFEIIVCAFKAYLTGLSLWVEKGSILQIVTSIIVIVLYSYLLMHYTPYQGRSNQGLAVSGVASLAFAFLMGLLLKVNPELQASTMLQRGYGVRHISILLICCVVLVLISATAGAAVDLRRAKNIPYLTLQGKVVTLPSLAPGLYHLFISHVWATGQAQAGMIKEALKLVIPGVKIWLDVDDLADLSELEAVIESCRVVLIFLSAGYFESWNCMREVRACAHLNKPLILVREPEKRNGGGLSQDELESALCESESKGTGMKDRVDKAKGSPPSTLALANHIFRTGIIDWHLQKDFKNASLKLIAHQMMLGMSNSIADAGAMQLHNLRVPGESALPQPPKHVSQLSVQVLQAQEDICARIRLGEVFCEVAPWVKVKFVRVAEPPAQTMHDARGQISVGPVIFLLVLHCEPGTDRTSSLCDNELQAAVIKHMQMRRVHIVMLHVTPLFKGVGIEFGDILTQAPQFFKKAGLFNALASPWHPGSQHQVVSARILAQTFASCSRALPPKYDLTALPGPAGVAGVTGMRANATSLPTLEDLVTPKRAVKYKVQAAAAVAPI